MKAIINFYDYNSKILKEFLNINKYAQLPCYSVSELRNTQLKI